MSRPERGMSYVEILVAAAILVTLAGVVAPAVNLRRIDGVAQGVDRDLNDLAQGVRRYIDDTRTFPTGYSGATTYHFLFTDGVRPDNNIFASGPGMHVATFLDREPQGAQGWRGPYLPDGLGPDPWGHAYLINVNGFFSSSERVVAISAGPNGQINTPVSATVASGDDIVVVIE